MGVIEIILIGLGLSFDTFAVSVSTGLLKKSLRFWQGVKIASIMAFFQGLMPLLGWLGGTQVATYISSIDHWIAFVLLTAVGLKMIVDSFRKEEEKRANPLQLRVIILMAIATSIDALIVGISLAFIEVVIVQSVLIIGAITFLAAMSGMLIGKSANGKFGKKVEIFGGIILIGIGLRIVLEHLLQ